MQMQSRIYADGVSERATDTSSRRITSFHLGCVCVSSSGTAVVYSSMHSEDPSVDDAVSFTILDSVEEFPGLARVLIIWAHASVAHLHQAVENKR